MPDIGGESLDLFIVDELQAMSGPAARYDNFFISPEDWEAVRTAASPGGFWEAAGITVVSSEAVPPGHIVAFDTARADRIRSRPGLLYGDAQVFVDGRPFEARLVDVTWNVNVVPAVDVPGERCDCPDCRQRRADQGDAAEAQTRREQASKVLLREFLDEEQRAEYGRSQHFDVISEGGRRYRVGGGWVFAQDGPLAGEQFCIQMYGFPSGDADLGRKLMLETDEVKFLTTAVGAHNHKRAKWKLIRGLLMSRYRVGLLRLGRQLDDFSVACSEAKRALDRVSMDHYF